MAKKPILDKNTCWYKKDQIVKEMNSNYFVYKGLMDSTQHIQSLKKNLDAVKKDMFLYGLADMPNSLIDIGCGTSQACLITKKNFHYTGADLDFIIEGCAKVFHPENDYIAFDAETTNYDFIKKFDVVLMNGFIDVMEFPITELKKVLKKARKYVIIHRQELTDQGKTKVVLNGSYGSQTYHSIISARDFAETYIKAGFECIAVEGCGFNNWERGGESIILRRIT